jgi:hypothetical protein
MYSVLLGRISTPTSFFGTISDTMSIESTSWNVKFLLLHMAEATGEIISDVIHHSVAIAFDRQLHRKASSEADEESLKS